MYIGSWNTSYRYVKNSECIPVLFCELTVLLVLIVIYCMYARSIVLKYCFFALKYSDVSENKNSEYITIYCLIQMFYTLSLPST